MQVFQSLLNDEMKFQPNEKSRVSLYFNDHIEHL